MAAQMILPALSGVRPPRSSARSHLPVCLGGPVGILGHMQSRLPFIRSHLAQLLFRHRGTLSEAMAGVDNPSEFLQQNPRSDMHVGIIPDGTRRWCAINDIPLLEGYRRTMQLLADVTVALYSAGVAAVSLYLLSKENLRRAAQDLAAVVESETRFCSDQVATIARDHDVRVSIAGDLTLVPREFSAAALHAGSARARGSAAGSRRLYLCIAYNPFDELRAAFDAMRETGASGDECAIMDMLWVPEQLDVVLRTGGRSRISNFLPLQSAYAELYFTDKLFNDVTAEEIVATVDVLRSADRSFGI